MSYQTKPVSLFWVENKGFERWTQTNVWEIWLGNTFYPRLMIMMGTEKDQQESLISPHPSIIGASREEVETSQVGAHSVVRVGPTCDWKRIWRGGERRVGWGVGGVED